MAAILGLSFKAIRRRSWRGLAAGRAGPCARPLPSGWLLATALKPAVEPLQHDLPWNFSAMAGAMSQRAAAP